MSIPNMISVIIPCYNQATFLDETLESVFNQTYKKWECIVINDGSTDNTEDVVSKWLHKDSRFKYYYQTNNGLSSARNAGIELATGAYIQLLDSDDLIKPKKFEVQLADLNHTSISICDYFSFIDGNIDKTAPYRYLSPFLSDKEYQKEIILDWEYRKSIPCHAIIFERSLITNNKIRFEEKLPKHEDWHFWCRVFYHSQAISNTDEVLALYRIRLKSMSSNTQAMNKGFIAATNMLISFFKNKNEKALVDLLNCKKKEIKSKNPKSIIKKIKSSIKSKLSYIYNYVIKN